VLIVEEKTGDGGGRRSVEDNDEERAVVVVVQTRRARGSLDWGKNSGLGRILASGRQKIICCSAWQPKHRNEQRKQGTTGRIRSDNRPNNNWHGKGKAKGRAKKSKDLRAAASAITKTIIMIITMGVRVSAS
jgi:hypothetical protein